MTQRFRPGWVPTFAAGVAVLILCSLGSWQVRRLHWRQGLLAAQSARMQEAPLELDVALASPAGALDYRRGKLRGRYDEERSIVVTHVIRDNREGARVLTPLRLDVPQRGFEAVIVDRGWLPYRSLAEFAARPPRVEPEQVTGLLFHLDLTGAEPGSREPRVEWVRFDLGRHGPPLQAQLPYRIAPLLVQRGDDGTGELPLGGYEGPRSPVDHRAYAITWYGMAVIAVAVWFALGLQRSRLSRGEAGAGA